MAKEQPSTHSRREFSRFVVGGAGVIAAHFMMPTVNADENKEHPQTCQEAVERLLLAMVPAPGGVAGDYSMEGNLAAYVDRTFLPGIILRSITDSVTTKAFCRRFRQSRPPSLAFSRARCCSLFFLVRGARFCCWRVPGRPAWSLAIPGACSFPSSRTCGPVVSSWWPVDGLLLLSAFYAVIDVLKFRWIAFFWVVIGMNAITIYVCQRFIDVSEMSQFFFGGVAGLANDNGTLVLVSGVLLPKWSLLYFLYRHRIFLRV